MSKRYKVVGSSQPAFMGIDVSVVFDNPEIGKKCEVFGTQFRISQTGKVMILSSKEWVLTLQELDEPEPKAWTETIRNYKDLRVNFEVDVFIKDKQIKLNKTERLHDDNGVTMFALYRFLANEWKYIEPTVNVPFPLDWHPEHNLMIMRDGWDFRDLDSIALTREGSFSRYNEQGRCI